MDNKPCKECMDVVTDFANKTDELNKRLVRLVKWMAVVNALAWVITAGFYFFQR